MGCSRSRGLGLLPSGWDPVCLGVGGGGGGGGHRFPVTSLSN